MKQLDRQFSKELEKMMEKNDFEFEIGDRVHHKIFGFNGLVTRKLQITDVAHDFNAYDIGTPGEDMRMYCEIDEQWMGKGHL